MSDEADVITTKKNLETAQQWMAEVDQLLKGGINKTNYEKVLTFFNIPNWDNRSSLVLRQNKLLHVYKERKELSKKMLSAVRENITAWRFRSYAEHCKKHDLPNNFVNNSLAELTKCLPEYQQKLYQIKKQMIDLLPTLNPSMPIWWPASLPLFESDINSLEAMSDDLLKDFVFQLKRKPDYYGFINMKEFKNKYIQGCLSSIKHPGPFLMLVKDKIKKELQDFLDLYRDFLIYKNIKEQLEAKYDFVRITNFEEFKKYHKIIALLPYFRSVVEKPEESFKSKLEAFRDFEEKVYKHNEELFLFFNFVQNIKDGGRLEEEKTPIGKFFAGKKPVWIAEARHAAECIITPHSKMLIAKINEIFDEAVIQPEQEPVKDISGKMEMN